MHAPKVRSLAGTFLLTVVAVVAPIATSADTSETDDFRSSLEIAGAYHRSLANLPAKWPDQPETAWYELEQLTEQARVAQHGVHIQPCFARWWAYEFMGLELTTLSHELRRGEGDYESEADMIERLGAYMWAQAMRVLPAAASACEVGEVLPRMIVAGP